MAGRRIALLRGINVGGHRKVPMAELRSLLADTGLTDVATYIQSGNVVFSSTLDDQAAAQSISRSIVAHFGFEVPVVVRDSSVLPDLLRRSTDLFPAVDATSHDKYTMVGFCSTMTSAGASAAIDPDRSPGDRVVVDGDHVHLSYRAGQGTTKLTGDYLERVLGTSITMRNLSTLRKLIDLAS